MANLLRMTPDPWKAPDKQPTEALEALVSIFTSGKPVVFTVDLDGYMLDYPKDMEAAKWVRSALAALRQLQRIKGVQVAVLTASRGDRVARLLKGGDLQDVDVYSYYGLERTLPGDDIVVRTDELRNIERELGPLSEPILSAIDASELFAPTDSVTIEVVAGKIVYRPRPPRTIDELGAVLDTVQIANGGRLEMKGGTRWELGVEHPYTKAFGMQKILDNYPDAAVVYGGDDHNDVPALELLLSARAAGRTTFGVGRLNPLASNGEGSPDRLAEVADLVVKTSDALALVFRSVFVLTAGQCPELIQPAPAIGVSL